LTGQHVGTTLLRGSAGRLLSGAALPRRAHGQSGVARVIGAACLGDGGEGSEDPAFTCGAVISRSSVGLSGAGPRCRRRSHLPAPGALPEPITEFNPDLGTWAPTPVSCLADFPLSSARRHVGDGRGRCGSSTTAHHSRVSTELASEIDLHHTPRYYQFHASWR